MAEHRSGQFLLAGRGDRGGLSTWQYAQLVQDLDGSIVLDPNKFGEH